MPASTRPRRRSLQWAEMIRSTSMFSSSPTGCSSALSRSPNFLRAASSSPGRRISSARRPCFTALRRTAVFPFIVLGPVLLRAFCRLASAFLALVIDLTFPWFIDKVQRIVVHSGLQWHCPHGRTFREYRSSLRVQAYYHEFSERAAEELVVPVAMVS